LAFECGDRDFQSTRSLTTSAPSDFISSRILARWASVVKTMWLSSCMIVTWDALAAARAAGRRASAISAATGTVLRTCEGFMPMR
jgi:hypothetical protein